MVDSFVTRLDPQNFVVKVTCCDAAPLKHGYLEIWQSNSTPWFAETIVRHQVMYICLVLVIRHWSEVEPTILDRGKLRIYLLSPSLKGHPKSASAVTPMTDRVLRVDVVKSAYFEHGEKRKTMDGLKIAFGELNTIPLVRACCNQP